jgi:hypothetical protein
MNNNWNTILNDKTKLRMYAKKAFEKLDKDHSG